MFPFSGTLLLASHIRSHRITLHIELDAGRCRTTEMCDSASTGSLEENIDVENFATMPLVSDFLEVLGNTWGNWSLSTKFAFKRLTGKKHVADATSVQSISADAQRGSSAQGASEFQAPVNSIRRRTVQGRKSSSYFMKDVASHDKPNDCWIVIKDKVCSSLLQF